MTGVVLLRAVPDLEALAPEHSLVLDGPSEVAVAQAVAWRHSADTRLIGLAAGPDAWEPALRQALALGLDEVTRVAARPDDAGHDISWTAAVLARAIPHDTHLVFAGAAATDAGSGALPAALAGLLGWPLLPEVVDVRDAGGAAEVEVRAGPGIRRTYQVPGPAILAAARMAPPPAYPPLRRRLAAARASIACIDPSTFLGLPSSGRMTFVDFGPGRPRTKHLLRPTAGAAAGARLSQLMAAGARQRTSGPAAGDSRDLARQLIALLESRGYLPAAGGSSPPSRST